MTANGLTGGNQNSSNILLPFSADHDARVVRFENTCVLIPSSKRSKPLKTYSVPLWKKRSGDADVEAPQSPRLPSSPEETHVVFKVPIPRFISRSPSRGRSPTISPPKPLYSCLVNRDPPNSPSTQTRPRVVRRTSLPVSIPVLASSKPRDDNALTVPLRPCCNDCVPVTEESYKKGDGWQEMFSKGARRRRSASLDNNIQFGNFGTVPSSTVIQRSMPFTSVTASSSLDTPVSSGTSRYHRTSAFSITVDEVDKRRKSLEHVDEDLKRFRAPSPHAGLPSPTNLSPISSHSHRSPEREKLAPLNTSLSVDSQELSRRIKSSPIQEEDEDQLFPLPSPRRSPVSSISASPVPSPNASKDNLSATCAIQDGVLSKSLSRKTPEFLAPPSLTDQKMSTSVNEALPSIPILSSPARPLLAISTAQASGSSKPLPVPPSSSRLTSSFKGDPTPGVSVSPSTASSLSRSPISPTRPRRPSFSIPAIKDAMTDMLRGVSSFTTTGTSVGSM